MIGIINFTHSDPLFLAVDDKSKVIRDSPSNIFRMLEEGKLTMGMISLVTYLKNRDKYRLLKSANIHSLRATMSTLLVSKGKELCDGMKIAVTSHTKTTKFYLQAVLDGMKIKYELIHTDKTGVDDLLKIADYALVIGDEALSVYGTNLRIVMDIGYEFSRIYSLSPVYAVTVSSGSHDESEAGLLDRAVADSSKYNDESAKANSSKFGLPENIFRRYHSLIRYDFNASVLKTIEFVAESIDRERTFE